MATALMNAPTADSTPRASKRTETKRRPRKGELAARYFLIQSSGGKLELGEEKPSEHEAMVAALKSDSRFVIVTEWRPKVETGRGGPIIRKEASKIS